MANNSPFKGHILISNHGTSTGIIPRFFNQILDIAQYAIGKEEAKEIFDQFLQKSIPDFTDFYDLHEDILSKYDTYNAGLRNGQFYSKNSQGQFSHDRSLELELERKVKDFFILGRLLINNFMKSGIIDLKIIPLTDLIIVKDGAFAKHKKSFLDKKSNMKFDVLIKVIEYARNNFLSKFNSIRSDIEHNQFKVPNFVIDTETDEISEPTILGLASLREELTFFYNELLALIELILVLYYGILGTEKYKILGLYERDSYDFSNLKSRFVLLPRMDMSGHTLLF